MDDDLIMGDDYGDPEESGEESNPIGGESESGGSGSSESGSSEPSSKDINTVPLISDNDLRSGIKILISDATGAIKRASIADVLALISGRNGGGHNSFYRGEQIGTSVTNAQWSAIYNGTFDDMFIGDYWLIDNIAWRIAGFDYWRNRGNVRAMNHHVVIVPDVALTTATMNSTATTLGAYGGSDFRTGNNSNTGRSSCINKVNDVFGSTHIMTYKDYFENAVTDGRPVTAAWYDASVELLSETMVFGFNSNGNYMTIDYFQLPLFALNPASVNSGNATWALRDVASETTFKAVSSYYGGTISAINGNSTASIRPFFSIYSATDPLAS